MPALTIATSNATAKADSPFIKGMALYSSQQVYAMEDAWFKQGYSSFALMQQAAWQITQHIITQFERRLPHSAYNTPAANQPPKACVWVGSGNNGGDGWLAAYYLQQAGWQVQIVTLGTGVGVEEIAEDKGAQNIEYKNPDNESSDAQKAQHIAVSAGCAYQRFEDMLEANNETQNLVSQNHTQNAILQADVYIDALFGIGLNRAPTAVYKQAIDTFNQVSKAAQALVVAIDIPSGLVATTGQVFAQTAIQADITLCLIARKFGLHTKDGMDYAGVVLDIPLIPYPPTTPLAVLLDAPYALSPRYQNSYKGSYGHVLIIAGNRIDNSQGMGGAAILSASSAMATGAGKITVACHEAFHGALLTSLPDAMTIKLHDVEGVKNLIQEVDIVAIGMGLGRDFAAQELFISYVQAAICCEKPLVIDADGLYHLAALSADEHPLVAKLKDYSSTHQVCLTPHSGEAAKLLDTTITAVEADRCAAIMQCAHTYGGDWVLKGAGSLVLEQAAQQVYVCTTGNAGMATAGMGDVLAGLIAGLLAQQDLTAQQRSLSQAVLIHGRAGDVLVDASVAAHRPSEHNQNIYNNGYDAMYPNRMASLSLPMPMPMLIGQRGLQAQDMPMAIRHVMQGITIE